MRYWAYVVLAIIVGVIGIIQGNDAQTWSAWAVLVVALILSDIHNTIKKSK